MFSCLRQYWTHRDEQIGDLLLVALPSLAILSPAPVDIPVGAVDDHHHEENEVEPGERAPVDRLSVTAQFSTAWRWGDMKLT